MARTGRLCGEYVPVTKQESVKFFTIEEANSTLPLVKRVVADILADHEIWSDRMRQYELLSAGETGEDGESAEQISLREEVDAAARRITGYLKELAQIGCVFKGFEVGLVDFYSKREGRDVMLCWKYGEVAVQHWHEVDGGFAGRVPIEREPVSVGA